MIVGAIRFALLGAGGGGTTEMGLHGPAGESVRHAPREDGRAAAISRHMGPWRSGFGMLVPSLRAPACRLRQFALQCMPKAVEREVLPLQACEQAGGVEALECVGHRLSARPCGRVGTVEIFPHATPFSRSLQRNIIASETVRHFCRTRQWNFRELWQ